MISKLPRWIGGGGFLLAFVAGSINAVGLMGLQHEGVTHMTGTASLAAIAVSRSEFGLVPHLAGVLGAFLLGAILSGIIIQQSTLRLGQRYGVALFLESMLLLAAIPLLARGYGTGDYFAACACGLQNAMASSYSGAILRTTHITGVVTDAGIFIGHWLRGLSPDPRPFRLHLTLLSGFITGSLAGALLFQRAAYNALYLPVALTGGAAIAYTLFRFIRRQGESPTQTPSNKNGTSNT